MTTEGLLYIDWNLYSILKDPRLEPHIRLKIFLENNREKIKLVYSDAHIGDIAKTSEEFNETRIKDLDYLSKITNDVCIVKYFGRKDIELDSRNAVEFYNTNKQDNESSPISTLLDTVKTLTDSYGGIRDEIIKKHFNLDPNEICNFSVDQLDKLIKIMGISKSLNEFLELGLNLRGDTSSNPITYVDYYMTAFINLDLISFFPDAMNEPGNFDNLLNDAKHSAYGSLCKAFITNDNKCFYKSKLLFEYFHSKSILIKTCKIKGDLKKLEEELNRIIN